MGSVRRARALGPLNREDGDGFSSTHTAAYLGRRFGIVCFIEELVGLQRSSNMRITRQGYFYARPSEGRIDELLRYYGRK